MKALHDPPRLVASPDAPAILRQLIAQAHDQARDPIAIEQLVLAVERRLPLAAPSALTAPSGAAPRPWFSHGNWMPWGSAVVLLGLSGAVGVWSTSRSSSAPVAAQVVPSAEPQPEPTPGAVEELLAPSEDGPVPSAVAIKHNLRATPTARPQRIVTARPTAPSPIATNTATATPTDESVEEYRLVRSARDTLASDPAGALRQTDEHRRRFARGMLVQEREAIAIDALVRLGRRAEARSRGKQFCQSYPASPYRARVDAALSKIESGAP